MCLYIVCLGACRCGSHPSPTLPNAIEQTPFCIVLDNTDVRWGTDRSGRVVNIYSREQTFFFFFFLPGQSERAAWKMKLT